MNIYTKEVIKLLKIDEKMADKVLSEMWASCLDFSECSTREFNEVAKLCYDFVKDIQEANNVREYSKI